MKIGLPSFTVQKIHIAVPVLPAEVMLARPQVIADGTLVEYVAHLGEAIRMDKAGLIQAFPGPGGGNTTEILMGGAGPFILDGAAHQEQPGRDGRQQPVLLKGQGLFVACIGLILLTKPEGEIPGDIGDMLAGFSPGDGCAAAAGSVSG